MGKYKITAEDSKEFDSIKERLDNLPESVTSQIEYAEKKFSYIHCTLFQDYNEVTTITLPIKGINSVEVGQTGIVAYDDKFRYFKSKTEKQVVKISFR